MGVKGPEATIMAPRKNEVKPRALMRLRRTDE